MKTTVILLGLGAVTIGALIFVAQNQNRRSDAADRRARGNEVRAKVEPTAASIDSSATFDEFELSNSSNDEPTPQPAAPRFEGDPWQVGVKAYEEGDFELAVTALEQAVEDREDSAYRHYLLGLAYRQVEEFEAAVEEFSRSLSLAPDQPRAYAHLGRSCLDLGDKAGARAAVDQGLERDLEHADLWQVLGRIELDEGKWEEAAVAFTKATELDPEHRWAWNNLGYTRLLQGRSADAVVALQRATEYPRAESAFFNNLGLALEQSGDLAAASEAFARAEELGSDPASSSLERILALLDAQAALHGPELLAESH